MLENLLSPDLIIVGGGVSKSHEEFLPLINDQGADRARRAAQQRRHLGAAWLATRPHR